MYSKLVKNDIKKNKLITAAIAAFILVSALLISMVAMLTVNMFSAIENMLALANSSHFTRMHAGTIDMEQIDQFAQSHDNVKNHQVLEYLNIESPDIIIGGSSLEDSSQDNGFSTQSEEFDFLLGLKGEVLHPAAGEIYVPLFYLKTGSARVGDAVSIHGVQFTVKGFLRDSLMNPAMASSKRFLINENDFEKLRNHGIMEYLIEFQLYDPQASVTFESGYIGAGMPSNGPLAITYPLVRMMNGIEDGMMIAILALISILVIIVSFLCIRFTLLAKIEEDYREIGVLKAVGLRVSGIKRLYTAKYGVIAGVSCVLGFLLSLLVQKPFMANIRLYLGVSNHESLGLLSGAAGAAAIYLVIMLYVNGVLRRFRKISPAQAIRFGAPEEKTKAVGGFLLSKNRLFSTNMFLAVQDVLSRKKLYFSMFLVLVMSSFILVVPQNISNTISSPRFYTQMGLGLCDFSAYVAKAQTQDVAGTAAEIAAQMSNDESIAKQALLITRMFEMPPVNGAIERMQVALGDHDIFPIDYTQGSGPQAETDIAISAMYADDFNKTVGDEIVLIVDGREKSLTVCGIYSDISNNGKTAKAVFTANEGEVLNASVLAELSDRTAKEAELSDRTAKEAELSDRTAIEAVVSRYQADFPNARISGTEERTAQLMGTMTAAIAKVSYASIAIAALLTILITLLFMKMLVAKDRYPITILKSLGFTNQAIRTQYTLRAVAVFVLAVVIGIILANTLGEFVGLALITSSGASTFQFEINPLFAYVFAPLLLAICVCAAAFFGIADVTLIKISDHIKEA